MDQYEYVKKLGSGNFGVINLMRRKETGELVAVKQLPRGPKIDKNVYREVINHRKLSHPNVIGFNSVHIDSRYLYIVMEYGAGAHRFRFSRALAAQPAFMLHVTCRAQFIMCVNAVR
jgi:serine/threonine-protein kinase SRK2